MTTPTPDGFERERENQIHNHFCQALLDDFRKTTRYIAIEEENAHTFSIEYIHLLLGICSEMEALAKLCSERREPGCFAGIDRPNIGHWGAVIRKYSPPISTLGMQLDDWFTCVPWESWSSPNSSGDYVSPDWWRAYNDVKHNRTEHRKQANQHNVMCALCGLAALSYLALPPFSDSWMNTKFLHRIQWDSVRRF